MKNKYWVWQSKHPQKGSALLVVLMVLMVVSLLGITLLTVTTSNYKMTGDERDHKSVYYIAEAGINDSVSKISDQVEILSNKSLTHVQFFSELVDFINHDINGYSLNSFASQFGKQPSAGITVADGVLVGDVDTLQYSEKTFRYALNSRGQIGNSNSLVSSSIDISQRIDKGSGRSLPSETSVKVSIQIKEK